MNTRTGKIGQLAENRLWSSVFLGILSLAVLLPNTGTPEVLGQGDETMHIATIEQSLARQSYLIPILEHAPNFYKPPLLFWISMASASIAGDDLLGVRLPSIIFALFAVILVYLMLRDFRMNAIIALMISVAYLFSLAVFKFGRLLMFEQAMALSVILICFFFGRYLLSGKRLYVVLAGIVSALSFMYKGPIFQVYSGLLLLSWALVHLLRVKPDPWRWPGKKKIREILIVAVLFHVPMILPLIWLVYLSTTSLMQDVSGFDWIAYFFIAENLAKFRESNQPAGRLLQGWLLYSLPWTPILIVLVVAAFRTSIRTNRQMAGWIFLVFTINVTLLHLIPHRKDPYYVVPFVPTLFVAIGLLLKSRVMYFHRAARLQQVFLLIVSLLFIMSGVYFYAEWWFWVVIPIVITIQIAILASWKWIALHPRRGVVALAITNAITLMVAQFVVIPMLYMPLIPKEYLAGLGDRICIVSSEPWDGYAFQQWTGIKTVVHNVPGTPDRCEVERLPVISFRAQVYEQPIDYSQIGEWLYWAEEPDFSKWFSPSDLRQGILTPVRLYLPIDNTSN